MSGGVLVGEVRESLRRLRVKPSKDRGQNFIIAPAVVAQIVSFGRVPTGSPLLEIGPGLGALTTELAALGNLTVVELEEQFCNELAERFPQIRIINADIREVCFSELGSELVVFGNLPYSFSTEILFHLVSERAAIRKAVLMLQKEFVARLTASPGSRTYGVLSITGQLYADLECGPLIGGGCFYPPAKVDSQLVQLYFRNEPRVPIHDEFWFRRVLSAAFFRRRKKIVNSLQASGAFNVPQIEAALAAAKIDSDRRPETLTAEEFVRLANELES